MEPIRRAFSVAVYPRHAGRVLIIKHRRLGVWLPPGGEIEAGETPLEAAARELREETGLEGGFPELSDVDGTPHGLIGYEEHPAGSKGTHLNFVFVADVTSDVVRACDEFDEWRWVTLAEGPWSESPPNVGQLARVALAAGVPPRRVGERWLQAWNARDLAALDALYAEDAVHESPKLRQMRPETGGVVRGKPAIFEYFRAALARIGELRFELSSLTADGARAIVEYHRHIAGQPTIAVVELLEVHAGRITHSRVFHA